MSTMLLFPALKVEESLNLPLPSPHISKTLLELYRARVDTVYKIVHWPTFIAHVGTDRTQRFSSQALESAIYFVAACTITDSEAQDLSLGDRTALLKTYRTATQGFLMRSSLLQHPDVTTLQAFVIYLVRYILSEVGLNADIVTDWTQNMPE